MKVQASIRRIFEEQHELNNLLLAEVSNTFLQKKDRRWHFESRLKELPSFAVKLETGRVNDPARLEDFLACTLVVPNTNDIKHAYNIVVEHYDVQYRRPAIDGETVKAANAFPFDDLRLYLKKKKDDTLPETRYDDVVFELQIKTFLQHAWGIATHDLNYKTDEISWSKDRIVAHLKAAVEHVELSLHEAKILAASDLVNLTDPRTKRAMEIVTVLKSHWQREELPANIRGMADAIEQVLQALRITATDLNKMLESAKSSSGGSLPLNLSPYGTILQLLTAHHLGALNRVLSDDKTKFKILVTPEMDLPKGFPSAKAMKKLVRLN